MTDSDEAVLRMLAGANFGPGAKVVLPSGREIGGDEAQALSSFHAPAAGLDDDAFFAANLPSKVAVALAATFTDDELVEIREWMAYRAQSAARDRMLAALDEALKVV